MAVTERKTLSIKLSAEERAAIEAHPDFEPANGRAGGIGGFIRALVRRECGLDEPKDYHEQRSKYWAKQREKRQDS